MAEVPSTVGDEPQDVQYKNESPALALSDDTASQAKVVMFDRDSGADVHSTAAALLGLPPGERVRCVHLPLFEKKLGWSVHLYIDLQGAQHGLPHNTLATQLWLVANLPEEPPTLQPDSINGAALLVAEDVKSEEYVQLDLAAWDKIVQVCKDVQPNAQFSV